jgi:glycolate dehydrogenase FAD-binding subunit
MGAPATEIATRARDAAVRARLQSIVGAERVSLPGEGARVDGVAPRFVVRPRTVDEVRAVLRACSEQNLAIVPTGRGRHLDIGSAPERCDVLLRLEHLASVIDHQPGDMTVTAAAGCTLAALQRVLGRHRQWLPIDPPAPSATTVGGLIAANLSGPLRGSQGTVRDLLIGLEVVAADGTLVRGGGRVVKNVAGFDLPKLHVGALGSLGVVVSATFKVRPQPAAEKALVVPCATLEDGGRIALALRDAADPLWLELVGTVPFASERSRAGDEANDRSRPLTALAAMLSAGEPVAVVAGAGGLAVEVSDAIARFAHAASVRGARGIVVDDAAGLRAALSARWILPGGAVIRISTLPTAVGAAAAAVREAAQAEGTSVTLGAHVASGLLRAAVASEAAVPELVQRLRSRAVELGGHLVVERARAEVKGCLVGATGVWGDPGPGLALMRGVKSALDPSRILSPGRLPGGI